jgi:hypothetical protein
VYNSLDLMIDSIVAREVLDSRGTPTVEAEVYLDGGASGRGEGQLDRGDDLLLVSLLIGGFDIRATNEGDGQQESNGKAIHVFIHRWRERAGT